MKIAFVADARSPIALNWIRYFVQRAHDVHVISSYPCSSDVIPGAEISEIAIAFSQFSRVKHNGTTDSRDHRSALTRLLASLRTGRLSGLTTAARFSLGSIEVLRHVERARSLIAGLRPDIVHAMRIPFEGILAAKATPPEIPLLLSVWGNDFTFFASRYPAIARQTREALGRAHALHSDTRRDIDLAYELGFGKDKPATVLPGGG
ncbi:MAG: glycosyltransferase, partial [Terriglobia bacterium]